MISSRRFLTAAGASIAEDSEEPVSRGCLLLSGLVKSLILKCMLRFVLFEFDLAQTNPYVSYLWLDDFKIYL